VESKLDMAIASLQECQLRFKLALLNLWHFKSRILEQEEMESLSDGFK
jgi:hypothetical protein